MKKWFLNIWLLTFLAALPGFTLAKSYGYSSDIIENIISKYNVGSNVGVMVQSLNSGQVIYQRNADQLFMPASSLKVFTAAAALSYLGSSYRFQTKLYATASQPINGVLDGDVYFYFDGDPALMRQDLRAMLATLANSGVRVIRGNLYIDDTTFDQAQFGPGWMWDERNLCYAAPTSAISIDHNCFPLSIEASRNSYESAKVTTGPGYSFIPIVSKLISLNVAADTCSMNLRSDGDNSFYLSGCVPPGSAQSFLVAVRNMRIYADGVMRNLLADSGIEVTGTIKYAALPESPRPTLLLVHNSAPLNSLVHFMLKKSDNLFADAIYKKLGAAAYSKAGTWKNGAHAVAAILSKNTGIDFSKIRLVDGCGLSREDLVTPRSLVRLVSYAYRDAAVHDSFLQALPIAGVDGHLQNRMASIRGRVRAKTGTMSGITSLAGYIFAANGQVYAFSIMVNNFLGSVHKYQQMEDEMCVAFYRS
jgi:D-alanyl-D-alanine carboxypeptidase/D-alanyl-D-alanine-endopeptidase (penicillin-binding protein 4)